MRLPLTIFLLLGLLHVSTKLTAQCDRARDSLVLVDFYLSTTGSDWDNQWDLHAPLDEWYGVQLSAEGCITCLDLDGNPDCVDSSMGGNNLIGPIPNSIGDLSELMVLSLSENKLNGALPAGLGNLSKLNRLRLDNNNLSGCIPAALSALCSILEFRLDANGQLPWEGDTSNFCNGTNQIGASCNDGNSMTSGEFVSSCCNCTINPDCDNDISSPDLSGLAVIPNMEFSPNYLINEQAVLDEFFSGTRSFVLEAQDNCSQQLSDFVVIVGDQFYSMNCGDLNFIEWQISDGCGNAGVNSATGGADLYRIEWTIGVPTAETYEYSVCIEDFDGTNSPMGWDPVLGGDDPNNDGIYWLGNFEVTLDQVDLWSSRGDGYNCMSWEFIDPSSTCSVTQELCIQIVGRL